MSDLSDKFTDLETQLAGQAATIGAYIDTVEAKLQAIADTLDILNENGAANTKYILAALSQTGACFPCPSPPMIVPPIGTTPGAINTDRCKRSQAIIAVIHALLENMDTMQSFNVIGTYNVVAGAISDYIGTIAAGDTVPLPSAPEAINIVGDYVSYAGERVFSGVGLVEQFSPLEADLITAIANTTTPGEAQSAYNAAIELSGVSNGARLLFEAIAYTALWSYYFDPDSTPDLSAYDGSVCGIAECVEMTSAIVTLGGSGAYNTVQWEEPLPGIDHTPASYPSSGPSWCTVDLAGWTLTPSVTVRVFDAYIASEHFVSGGADYVFPADSVGVQIREDGTTDPFTVQLCPPV